ncbi:hypothetical protein BH09BAC4_BH09BAC4_41270 [soil metagenome]
MPGDDMADEILRVHVPVEDVISQLPKGITGFQVTIS